MYNINPMPPQIDKNLIDKLAQVDVGTIGHFLDDGFMQPSIRQQMPGSLIAGTAITVHSPFPDSVIGHYALKFIRPGDILVIDRGDDRKVACWGGGTSLAAAKLGLTGLIMDGAGNDISESNEIGLPIWCDGVTGITTRYRGFGGSLNVPLQCGGVAVNPGDAILADENGVLVIPAEKLEVVVGEAIAFAAKEKAFRELYSGAGPYPIYPDLTGASDIAEGKKPD